MNIIIRQWHTENNDSEIIIEVPQFETVQTGGKKEKDIDKLIIDLQKFCEYNMIGEWKDFAYENSGSEIPGKYRYMFFLYKDVFNVETLLDCLEDFCDK